MSTEDLEKRIVLRFTNPSMEDPQSRRVLPIKDISLVVAVTDYAITRGPWYIGQEQQKPAEATIEDHSDLLVQCKVTSKIEGPVEVVVSTKHPALPRVLIKWTAQLGENESKQPFDFPNLDLVTLPNKVVNWKSAVEATMGTPNTVRRDIMDIWNVGPPDDSEYEKKCQDLDRIMIAFHRLQTLGKVEYRRLCGMHGGGGGNRDPNFRKIMKEKMDRDVTQHYPQGTTAFYPYYWPELVPNAADPIKIESDYEYSCFTYTFCWHAEPEFIIWHRALVLEFELLLNEYDPVKGVKEFKPLGVPYWGWEEWDGSTLPIQVTSKTYTVRSTIWKDNYKLEHFCKGYTFANPFHRWFAPVSLEDQLNEKFPTALNDTNCTTRAQAFEDPNIPHMYPWRIRSIPGNPSMSEVVSTALSEPDYKKFATMKSDYGGAQFSIENSHNKFHNYIGGHWLGGAQGQQTQAHPFFHFATGTMAQNQSIFDPIFWLHHSNIERQFCSWQQIWPESKPPEEVLKRIIYPWTKPKMVTNGHYSWNTEPGEDNDGTCRDWFYAELPYKYDKLLPKPNIPVARELLDRTPGLLIAWLPEAMRGGEFTVEDGQGNVVASLGVLNSVGSGCCKCVGRNRIDFLVENVKEVVNRAVLKRNGVQIDGAKFGIGN